MSNLTFFLILLAIIVICVIIKSIKIADANEVMVISGVGSTKDGKPITKRGQAHFVWPFLQTVEYFSLHTESAMVTGEIINTKTGIKVSVGWAVQYTPTSEDAAALDNAITRFLGKDEDEIENSILEIVCGGLHSVIAGMTPEEVIERKDGIEEQVQKAIAGRLKAVGYSVILSVHEIEDPEGSTYLADLAAKETAILAQSVAEEEGKAEVVRQQQEKLIADEERRVETTKAETMKEVALIEADTEAESIGKLAKANADETTLQGDAEAGVVKVMGEAEAKAAKLLYDAKAANNGVGFLIDQSQINADANIEIAERVAVVMSEIGKNATFYDFGGGAGGPEGKDLLTRVMGNLPLLLKEANLKNTALNGEDVDETVAKFANALFGSLGAAILGKTPEGTASDVIEDGEEVEVPDHLTGPIGPEDYD